MKICCGGFNLGDGLELDGTTLKATGGGGGGAETLVVHATPTDVPTVVNLDKSYADILAAVPNVVVSMEGIMAQLTADGSTGMIEFVGHQYSIDDNTNKLERITVFRLQTSASMSGTAAFSFGRHIF